MTALRIAAASKRAAPSRLLLPPLLAALFLAACTNAEPAAPPSSQGQSSPTSSATAPPSPPSPSPTAEWKAFEHFSALWPETAASEVPPELPPWRQSAEQTVHEFATSVLEWEDPQVEPTDSRFNTTSSIRAFTVARADSTPAIEVHARRIVDADTWSVTYLWGFDDDEPSASVSITPEQAFVGFDYWGASASAQLLLRYGGHQLERTATEDATWKVPITFPLDEPGAVIVLFRDADGHVYTGWGTSLPAGDFHAG